MQVRGGEIKKTRHIVIAIVHRVSEHSRSQEV